MVAAALVAPALEVVMDETPDRSPVAFERYQALNLDLQRALKERDDHETTLQQILSLHALGRKGEAICWCETCSLARKHLLGNGARPRRPRSQLALPFKALPGGRMRELDDD